MLDNKMLVLLIIGLLIFFFSKKSKGAHKSNVVYESDSESDKVEEVKEDFLNENTYESGPADFRASEIVNDYEYSNESEEEIQQENFGQETVSDDERGIDEIEYFAESPSSEQNDRNVAAKPDTTRPVLNNKFESKLTTMDPNKIPEKKEQKLNAADYLPKKSDKEWFKDTDIVKLDDSALLKAKPTTFIGVDTVSTSLRNASLDLRGDIPNPKKVVSPWNNTTITSDTNRARLY